MEKFNTIENFKELQDRIISSRDTGIPTIIIPAGTCGQASGANDLIRITKRELLERRLTDQINLRITGCHGFCEMEPSVLIEPGGVFYPKVGIKEMVRIVDAVIKGDILDDLLFADSDTGKKITKQINIPFFKKQVRTILSRNEKVDPIRIYKYIEYGGYSSLVKVLEQGEPEWVLDEVKTSGLRGRGGAGFPTGLKWELLSKQQSSRDKFLICNGDEGDPGAYMDRSVLEGNPQSIIEGMIIGAYATGATEGIIYVRNEYPLAVKHLIIALRQARESGFLGANIFGTGFSFDIKLIRGAGAFVCGEETALINSIEGKTAEPRQRPPFPIQQGIDKMPTAINNAETWANIPIIISDSAREFAKIGTENNSGTKIFSLVGKVKYTGLVEVPMGTSIKEIVYGIGGGPVDSVPIKAVQIGGPSGGCLPADKFYLPIDYDSLSEAGTIMGSGGMIVLDEKSCVVDLSKYFMNFLKDESCGKCFTCRKGTQRMYEILEDITRGNGTLAHLDLLSELAYVVKDTTMCGLGQSASNPILSTLRYFHEEYKQHIMQKCCSAFVCKELVGTLCQAACPLGTEVWRYIANIARNDFQEAYRVIRKSNPFPSVCARVCNHPCEDKCTLGTTGSQPVAIRALKRFITDRVDPSVFKQEHDSRTGKGMPAVAVIGSGPAGLSAAHYLSLRGYQVTVFEEQNKLGGMLLSCIPAYRLPREVLKKEIEALITENVSLKYSVFFGRDITIDDLFDQGFKAVFIATGAHKSMKLNIEGESSRGIYPAIKFLKACNLFGEKLGKGHVGIIGGGNSALDAARVSVRHEDVESVTIFYRRSRKEMSASKEEIEAALEEGINLEILISPVKIHSKNDHLVGLDFVENELGDFDTTDRRRPIPVPGTERTIPLDTLIVAIGEQPDTELIASMGITINRNGTLQVDPETLSTNHPGVFAGGDNVSGSNSVVYAIADGKKAAIMIDRYLQNKELKMPPIARLPKIFIEPLEISEEERCTAKRVNPPVLPVEFRKQSFEEVENPNTVL